MHLIIHSLLLVPLCFSTALASFLTGTYPPPADLSSNKSVVAANWKNFTQTIDSYLKPNGPAAYASIRNVTFSVGLFSVHDPAASRLQYHHTSAEVANSPNGTNKVDGDSIYRIASVSKLVTVFAAMLQLTEDDWNRPVSQIIPELATINSPNGTAYTIDWNEITPWALASQMAGIPQLGVPAGDLLFEFLAGLVQTDPITELGYPPVNIDVQGLCIYFNCSAASFAQTIRSQPPTLPTWTSPAYSDSAFMILGFLISAITGQSINTVYRESIFSPLGMDSSNSTIPSGAAELARCVVSSPTAFFQDGGFTTPSGGILSSLNDLDKFGIALLNSTLLAANVTRKWMKPITHTPSLTYSVGAPFEIHRYIHPVTGKVTDLYTKLGDSGPFGGATVLIPEYGAGISLAATASDVSARSNVDNVILDSIINLILPALEAEAAVESALNFAGTYVSTNPNLNSSVTIAVDKSTAPGSPKGLAVTRWISNGTNVLASDSYGGLAPVLLPSIPNPNPDSAGQVTFQASLNLQTNSYKAAGVPKDVIGPFTGAYGTNIDWMLAGQSFYAGVNEMMFVFDVDASGRAVAMSPAVTRVTLQRRQ